MTDKAVSPLTPEELMQVRQDHDGEGTCTYIQAYPCLHARLLATLDAARAGVRDPEEPRHRPEWLDGVPTGFCECGKPQHPITDEARTALGNRPAPDPSTALRDDWPPKEAYHQGFLEATRRAALRSTVPVEGLDVERLARALEAHFGPSWLPGLTDVTIHGGSPREVAEQIAREYAALAAQPDPEPREEEG